MKTTPKRVIRKFNPGRFQSDEEIIDQFVVRRHERDAVLEVLSGNIHTQSCQHLLVIAPRGQGKTMLLARVIAELRTNERFSGCLLPVRFAEESHRIFNISDFWLETLLNLAREISGDNPELAKELRETYSILPTRWQDGALEEHAYAAVQRAVAQLGRKLVLMVENLHSLCDLANEDFGWKLRAVLQSEPKVMLLATATSYFAKLANIQQPFFELFRIVDLHPLDTEDCWRLWRMVGGDAAKWRENEIRAIEILTGGSPRLLTIMGEFARHRSLPQLMETLVELIDDHTEYFRSNLEMLPKTERRVYLAVVDLWRPSSASEIAECARVEIRVVSTLLGRLVRRGVVTVHGSGRKRFYAASESLHSIYYKLRHEGDEAAMVQRLIYTMILLYGEESGVDEMSSRSSREAREWPIVREAIRRAVDQSACDAGDVSNNSRPNAEQALNEAPTIDDGNVKRQFVKIDAAFEAGDFEEVIGTVNQILFSRAGGPSRVSELVAARALRKKAEAYEKMEKLQMATTVFDEIIERLGSNESPGIQQWIVGALVNKGLLMERLGEHEAAIAVYDEAINRFGASDSQAIEWRVDVALLDRGKAQARLGDHRAAIESYNKVVRRCDIGNRPNSGWRISVALLRAGHAQAQLGDHEAALRSCDEVIERFGASDVEDIQEWVAYALAEKGGLQEELRDYGAAIAAYDEAVVRLDAVHASDFSRHIAAVLVDKGKTYERLCDSETAIAVYDEIVKRFDTSDDSVVQWWVTAALLRKSLQQLQIGYVSEVLGACGEIEQRLDAIVIDDQEIFRWRIMCVRVRALLAQQQTQPAMDAFGLAYASFASDNETMMREMLQVVPGLIRAGAPGLDLAEILSSSREKSEDIKPLIVALRLYGGQEVRVPEEMLEVAKDICDRISLKARGKAHHGAMEIRDGALGF